MSESHKRSILKSASYRIVGSGGTAVIAYILTGQPIASIGIGIADLILGVVFFYIHERLWNLIKLK